MNAGLMCSPEIGLTRHVASAKIKVEPRRPSGGFELKTKRTRLTLWFTMSTHRSAVHGDLIQLLHMRKHPGGIIDLCDLAIIISSN